MHQLCREFVLAKRIAAGLIQIGQPLVLKQQKQESLTCFIRFYLTVLYKKGKEESMLQVIYAEIAEAKADVIVNVLMTEVTSLYLPCG